MTHNPEGGGIYCFVFGVDPVGVDVGMHIFVSVHYLLNQLMDGFDQTFMYTLLRKGEELIRF